MREKLSGRFGFLMVAAGCAVGLGNVWRFPFVVGQNGGAAFVAVYLFFLAILGFPLLAAELAVGRGSKRGIGRALAKLSRPGVKGFWRIVGTVVFAGNFVLMIYYTDVAGWLAKYAFGYLAGTHVATPGDAHGAFAALLADKPLCMGWMLFSVLAATAVCFAGVAKGVERVTKVLMVSLLALLVFLAAKALSLPGAAEGVKFYLYPDWARFFAHPWRAVMEAMGQAFFTLSLGIGCMTIFGSYIGKENSLAKESAWIIAIDTVVALLSGLVIFPACYSCGVEPSCGPGLIFAVLPEVFARMDGGRFWGFCFFLFLDFAALTTIIAVFECLIGGMRDEVRTRRMKKDPRRPVAVCVGAAVALASVPCVLFDGVLDIEDFAVSQLWLPIGALLQSIFVASPFGWGWMKFLAEANAGDGFKLPRFLRFHMAVAIPVLVIAVLMAGLVAK